MSTVDISNIYLHNKLEYYGLKESKAWKHREIVKLVNKNILINSDHAS